MARVRYETFYNRGAVRVWTGLWDGRNHLHSRRSFWVRWPRGDGQPWRA